MLQRRKHKPLGVRQEQREYPGHRAFVRSFHCAVPGCGREPIECAHVRLGVPAHEAGGVGMKPHDKWTIPLCAGPAGHHAEQHRIGEASFAAKYGIDLVALARDLARRSPHRFKWEAAEIADEMEAANG